MSERLVEGSKIIESEISRIQNISNELLYDIKLNVNGLAIKLKAENEKLEKQTEELCIESKKNNYAPMNFNSIHLRDKAEIIAQMRLNLASIQTNQVVMRFLFEKKNEYLKLNERLSNKANELAVLKKRFDLIKDPRSSERETNVSISLQNACVSIDESEKLRMEYDPMSQDELFRLASENNKTQTVTNEIINHFMDTCDLSPITGHGKIKDKPWWKVWK